MQVSDQGLFGQLSRTLQMRYMVVGINGSPCPKKRPEHMKILQTSYPMVSLECLLPQMKKMNAKLSYKKPLQQQPQAIKLPKTKCTPIMGETMVVKVVKPKGA
jgi:hypothetical protein